jgi:hypothetical protein
MPYEDRVRMVKFYRSAFGWQTETLGEEMGNYVLPTTVETNEKGPKQGPGAINGGRYPKSPIGPLNIRLSSLWSTISGKWPRRSRRPAGACSVSRWR